MFNQSQLKQMGPKYFSIILLDPYDVTVLSRNAGHYWIIHNSKYPQEGSCIIYHKHRFSPPYHQHGRAGSLRQAIKQIKGHYAWQMGGRKYCKVVDIFFMACKIATNNRK